MLDVGLIKVRRQAIKDAAKCEGCGATLAQCKAQRGKDLTAPPWMGCCVRGVMLDVPCQHRPSVVALNRLLDEIESGEVRDEAESLLESLTEESSRRDVMRRSLVRHLDKIR